MNSKFIVVVIVLVILLVLLYYLGAAGNQPELMPEVCFKNSCVTVELAQDELSRARGLMYRDHLPQDHGMLFIYDSEGIRSFWMKNTLIPLDMIWLDSNVMVVHIETALPCGMDPCQRYVPKEQAKYVLEVNGGYAREHGVVVGDFATILLYR